MSVDLHKVLGVQPGADPATVKRAYRRASKRAHPDTPGGSNERFALVKTARDVLSDPDLAAQYERTGEIGEKPADTGRGNALQCIAAAFDFAVGECAQVNRDPATMDLVTRMRIWIRAQIADAQRTNLAIKKAIDVGDKLSARFANTKTAPVMPQLIAGRATILRDKLAMIERNIKSANDALELLADETFDAVYKPRTPTTNFQAMLSRL